MTITHFLLGGAAVFVAGVVCGFRLWPMMRQLWATHQRLQLRRRDRETERRNRETRARLDAWRQEQKKLPRNTFRTHAD